MKNIREIERTSLGLIFIRENNTIFIYLLHDIYSDEYFIRENNTYIIYLHDIYIPMHILLHAKYIQNTWKIFAHQSHAKYMKILAHQSHAKYTNTRILV